MLDALLLAWTLLHQLKRLQQGSGALPPGSNALMDLITRFEMALFLPLKGEASLQEANPFLEPMNQAIDHWGPNLFQW